MEQPKGDNRRQIIQKIIDERLNVRYNKEKRGDTMTAITATKARENIYQLIQDVLR